MASIRSHRWSGLLVGAVIAAGCVQPDPAVPGSAPPSTSVASPATSVAPSQAAVATTEPTTEVTPEPTVAVTPEPTEEPPPTPKPIDPSCPNASGDVISVQQYVDAPTSCFRLGVRVRGWLDTPPPIGFEGPLVKPTWLYYPNGDSATSLWHQPPPEPDHVCANGEDCWWFFPHLDPAIGGLQFEPLERWVILTGHTRDPRAQRCRYEGGAPDPTLITICGRQLVVTAVEDAP